MKLGTISTLRYMLQDGIEEKREDLLEAIEEKDKKNIQFCIEKYQNLIDAEEDFEQWYQRLKEKIGDPEDMEYVIRCQDCEYYKLKEDNFPFHWCTKWKNIMSITGYCSLAIRKEEQ